jgi:small subunit ribosomal protein S20
VANIAQQKKRNRLAVKQRLRNRHAKSTIKTLFKTLDDTVAQEQADEAVSLARLLTRRIDQAAAKGVIHKNSAARKKSQVAHILARLPG